MNNGQAPQAGVGAGALFNGAPGATAQEAAPQAAAPGAPPEHAALSLSLPPRLSIPHGEAPWQGLCGIKESDTA